MAKNKPKKKEFKKPRHYPTPQDMDIAVIEYFNECDATETPYTVSGLVLHLGFCARQSLFDYLALDDGAYTDTITRAKMRIENYAEQQLFRDRGGVDGIKFSLNHNFGWAEKSEISHGVKHVGIMLDAEVVQDMEQTEGIKIKGKIESSKPK